MSTFLEARGLEHANGTLRPLMPPAAEQASMRKLRADNIALRDRVETLEETIRQLRAIMRPSTAFTAEWKLSKQETALLAFIYGRQVATNDRCIEALGRNDFHEQLGPDKLNHLRVVVVHLRTKLRPFDIDFHTIYGEGYTMDSENKARVRAGVISAGLVEN